MNVANRPVIKTAFSANGQTLVLPISGQEWGTVRLDYNMLGGTANLNVTAEMSIDGGTNWVPASYAKEISSVSANPNVFNMSAINLGVGGNRAFEFVIPANCTHFRMRVTAFTAVGWFTLSGGMRIDGTSLVCGVLFDVSQPANTINDTGTLETAGWDSISAYIVIAGGTTLSVAANAVDDTGTTLLMQNLGAAAGTFVARLPDFGGSLNYNPLPKRLNFHGPAVAAISCRIRVECRRGGSR